jgi:hypothetical protein
MQLSLLARVQNDGLALSHNVDVSSDAAQYVDSLLLVGDGDSDRTVVSRLVLDFPLVSIGVEQELGSSLGLSLCAIMCNE